MAINFSLKTKTETLVDNSTNVDWSADYLIKELNELMSWFNWYDMQVNQYNRCVRLNIVFDKDMKELDAQAVQNQSRISEIRNLLKGDAINGN